MKTCASSTKFRDDNHDSTCAVRLLRSCSLPPPRQRRWRRSIPATAAARAPTARARASRNRQRRSRAAPACCRCCRPMPSPSTQSTLNPASLPIPRLPERSRCSINRAHARRRFFTPLTSPRPTSRLAARPVTFVFNGGPGAASAFLNLGLVGPRIAEFGANGRDGSHVRLVDNPDTWLAFTDLVLDRSGRHRLEPGGQARRWPLFLERARRCRVDGQGHRALRREKQPRQFAEIHSRRKLRRLSRRQSRPRVAERSGHRRFRDS